MGYVAKFMDAVLVSTWHSIQNEKFTCKVILGFVAYALINNFLNFGLKLVVFYFLITLLRKGNLCVVINLE